MNNNGNRFQTLLKKLIFYLIPTSNGRTTFIMRHACEFHKIGGGIFWQPRKYPSDPELISIGNNVMVASGVSFVNHDIIHWMLEKKFKSSLFPQNKGCIEVGDNVMIGAKSTILPNVRIGSNVIIGAGSIVTKDIPDNSVAAGVPCRVIGKFEDLVEKRKSIVEFDKAEDYWEDFYKTKTHI